MDNNLTWAEKMREDGHCGEVNGTFSFAADLPEIGARDIETRVEWSVDQSGDFVIETVWVTDVIDGDQYLPELECNAASPLQIEMRKALVNEALKHEKTILEEHGL